MSPGDNTGAGARANAPTPASRRAGCGSTSPVLWELGEGDLPWLPDSGYMFTDTLRRFNARCWNSVGVVRMSKEAPTGACFG